MAQGETTRELRQARGPTGAIRRAHLAMQRCADAVFRPRRTTTDQFALLWAVGRQEGIRQNDLAGELYSDPNTVTAMLARLELRGLVTREVCGEDGRARRVRLTPAGRRLMERLSADWEPMRRRLREIFAGDSGQEALRILDEVRVEMTQVRAEILEKHADCGRRARGRSRPAVRSGPVES